MFLASFCTGTLRTAMTGNDTLIDHHVGESNENV